MSGHEGIAAEHVDGLEAEWRQAGDVLPGLTTFSPELGQGRVHTQRVPEHDDVDHWAERAELVFLAFRERWGNSPRLPWNTARASRWRPSPRLS